MPFVNIGDFDFYITDHEVRIETIPAGGSTPYAQLKRIVASYGEGAFSGDTAAKRDIYAAALDEHRGREADFTADDLKRVMNKAARA
jgi:hypothetical protein